MFAVGEKRLTVSDHIGPCRTNGTYRAINFPPALHAEELVEVLITGHLLFIPLCITHQVFQQAIALADHAGQRRCHFR